MRSSSLAFLRPPVLEGFDGEAEAKDESPRSSSSSSSSWSSLDSEILRFLLLELGSDKEVSEVSFLMGVSGRREEDAIVDDDTEEKDCVRTGTEDAEVMLVMVGYELRW